MKLGRGNVLNVKKTSSGMKYIISHVVKIWKK